MTGKRTWGLFGMVGIVAGLAWAVRSGYLGGGGGSPEPVMMTPAVTFSDSVTSGVAPQKPNSLHTAELSSTAGTVPKSKSQAGVKSLSATTPLPPARSPTAPSHAVPVPQLSSETSRVVQRAAAPVGLSIEQVLELVRAGRLAEAREALKSLPSNEGSAQLVRVVIDLERDLMEVGTFHRAGDWYQVEKVLERWDRPGRMVPRPEPPVVADARAWLEDQRRSRVSQKEWRLALEEALRWENRARIQSLLDAREYPDDPIRTRARARLATLESSEKRLAEIREHLRSGRLEAAERLLSAAEPQGRLEVKEMRDELVRRKSDQEAITRKWVSEIIANGYQMRRTDFEDSLRRIPAAQQANAAVKQAIIKARQQVDARESEASQAVAGVTVSAPAVRPVVPPAAIPTVIPPAARAPQPSRVATNTPPAADLDEKQFMTYKERLSGKTKGTIPPEQRKKAKEFLERYSSNHPEKAKEIQILLENLRNSL